MANSNVLNQNRFFILCVLLASLITNAQFSSSQNHFNYDKGGEDWVGDCRMPNQSPIDITGPFQYKKPKLEFHYNNMRTEYQFFNDGNHLLLEGDFGYVKYEGDVYFSSEIRFFAKSMHSFSNNKFPLEVQIYHYDQFGKALVVSMLFRVSDDYSIFLGRLGFDNEPLQSQRPFDHKKINEPINLSKYINDRKDFFIYSGLFPTPPCTKKTTFLILTDVLKVTSRQLNNFPYIVRNQNRNIQPKGKRVIYTTFRMRDVKKKINQVNKKLSKMSKNKKQEEKFRLKKKQMKSLKPRASKNKKEGMVKPGKPKKKKFFNKKLAKKNKKEKELARKKNELIKKAMKNAAKEVDKKKKKKVAKKHKKKTEKKKISKKEKKKKEKKKVKKNKKKSKSKNKKKSKDKKKATKKGEKKAAKKSEKKEKNRKMATKSKEKNKKKNKSKGKEKKSKKNNNNSKAKASKKSNKKATTNKSKSTKNLTKSSFLELRSNSQAEKRKADQDEEKEKIDPIKQQKIDAIKKMYKKTSINDTCADNVVPFKMMKMKIKAYKNLKRVNEPHFVYGTPKYYDTMPIDKEIPLTLKEKNRAKILKKYKRLMEAYNNAGTSDVDKKNILIQLKDMEKKLKSHLNLTENHLKPSSVLSNDVFFSFLQVQNDKPETKISIDAFFDELKNDKRVSSEGFLQTGVNKDKEDIFESFAQTKSLKDGENNSSSYSFGQIKKSLIALREKVSVLTGKPSKKLEVDFKNVKSTISKLQSRIDNTNVPTKDPKDLISDNSLYGSLDKMQISGEYTYRLSSEFNVKLYKLLGNVLDKMVKRFKDDDKVMAKMFKYYAKKLSPMNRIRITHANLAQIIIQMAKIDHIDNLDFNGKLGSFYELITKTVLHQARLFKLYYYRDIPMFSNEDISRVLNNIYTAKKTTKSTFNLLKGGRDGVFKFIKVILKNLPLVLVVRTGEKPVDKLNNDEELIMKYTLRDLIKIPKKHKEIKPRFGPQLRNSKKYLSLKSTPGQGKKAVNSRGQLDETELHVVVPWPKQCKTNVNQSPININRPFVKREFPLPVKLDYKAPETNITMRNDGLKLIFSARDFGIMMDGNHIYKAKEIHIHHPSEHTFGDNQMRAPLELQIIHEDRFGNKAAVAIFFRLSMKRNDFLTFLGFNPERNPIYESQLRNQIAVALESHEKLNMGRYVNDLERFISYDGTLTTPPCTKGIKWFLAMKKLEMTQDQLESFPILFGRETNIRGIFPLGNRKLTIN